jgi:hypothetical protein
MSGATRQAQLEARSRYPMPLGLLPLLADFPGRSDAIGTHAPCALICSSPADVPPRFHAWPPAVGPRQVTSITVAVSVSNQLTTAHRPPCSTELHDMGLQVHSGQPGFFVMARVIRSLGRPQGRAMRPWGCVQHAIPLHSPGWSTAVAKSGWPSTLNRDEVQEAAVSSSRPSCTVRLHRASRHAAAPVGTSNVSLLLACCTRLRRATGQAAGGMKGWSRTRRAAAPGASRGMMSWHGTTGGRQAQPGSWPAARSAALEHP